MPALRSADRVSAHMATRGTRSPEGSSPARPHGTGIYRDVPLWPGITWGDDSRCACSWGYLGGVRQVKVGSGACTVHVTGRKPGRETTGPLPPAPSDEELLAAIRAGTVTWELYLSAVRSWQAGRARLDAERTAVRTAVRQFVALIAEAADQVAQEADRSRCGTHKGYNLHLSRGARACPRCLKAEAEYSAGRKRAQRQAKAAAAGQEWQEAA